MIHPLRIAHRGASGRGLAPENTLAAIERAIQTGVDAVEIDVHGTADGAVVVIHDSTLARTTDCQGAVRDLTLAEIRRADAGSWFDPSFEGERVPTLEEVLDLARHRALVLIEVKSDYLAEKVLQIIDSMDAVSQVMVQSFNPQTVHRTKLLSPGLPAALVVGKLPTQPSRVRARKMVRELLEVGANALSIWHTVLTPQFFEEMRRRGVSVWTWTVDDQIVMRDLVHMGVQGIVTNYPNRLNETLGELEAEGLIQVPIGRRQRLKKSRWSRRHRLKKLKRRTA